MRERPRRLEDASQKSEVHTRHYPNSKVFCQEAAGHLCSNARKSDTSLISTRPRDTRGPRAPRRATPDRTPLPVLGARGAIRAARPQGPPGRAPPSAVRGPRVHPERVRFAPEAIAFEGLSTRLMTSPLPPRSSRAVAPPSKPPRRRPRARKPNGGRVPHLDLGALRLSINDTCTKA